jgi:carnitine O-acetyltransferase
VDFDATGKVSLDHLYVQDDPRAYFGALRRLDYCIPQLAKPYFAKLIEDYRQTERVAAPTVLDIGCSYGVNAALLKCDATIDELYERYGDGHPQVPRAALLAQDRAFVRSRRDPDPLRFVGLDSSAPALDYAVAAGLLDDAVHADLERNDPSDRQRALLASADVVISTGCIGYVSERTIRRVATASAERRPWMAHFVLRMFPYAPVADSLAELGYETVQVEGHFRQRRFASAQEQSQVLDALAASGVDPRGLEAEGWMYAQLFLSLPSGVSTHRRKG